MSMKVKVLWDANNLAIRNFMGKSLYTTNGMGTSLIVGCLESLESMVMNTIYTIYGMNPVITDMVMVWDGGRSERRMRVYPAYKGNRVKTGLSPMEKEAEELRWKEFGEQKRKFIDFLPKIGVRSLRIKGAEADDVIWAITEVMPPSEKFTYLIVSTDEDFHQCISTHCHVYNPVKKKVYAPSNYQQETGIPLSGFLTKKMLKGDPSDNIPGVRGIGDKRAQELILKYGDLRGILAHRNDENSLMKSAAVQNIFTRESLMNLTIANQLIAIAPFTDPEPWKEDIIKCLTAPVSVDKPTQKEFLREIQFMSALLDFKAWSGVWDCLRDFETF